MNSKTVFYEPYILKGIENGWGASHDNYLLDGELQHEKIIGDKCWGQAFYCIFLALHEDEVLRIKYTSEFLNGIQSMLKKTSGVFLRDNSEAAIKDYVENKNLGLEISKDQAIGLVCGLYFLYRNMSHVILKEPIREVILKLYEILLKHQWFLYNENEKRIYKSANYCQVHHMGFDDAFDATLGFFRKRNIMEFILYLTQFGKTMTKINLEWMLDVKNMKCWWQNITWLKKFPWYNYFRAGLFDFNINLVFFEGLIVGSESIMGAKWLIKILDEDKVKDMYHANLAVLYIYLCRKWNIDGKSMPFYLEVNEKRNEALYPEGVLPNELCIGSPWVVDQGDLWNHQIWEVKDWNMRFKPAKIGSMKELKSASKGRKVVVGNGLVYCAREFLLTINNGK